MKIAPALPSPQQPPASPGRCAVAPVAATGAARDAGDERARHPGPTQATDAPAQGRLIPGRETLATRQADHPAHVSRALASYARVANDGEHSSLRELLGFDAYA